MKKFTRFTKKGFTLIEIVMAIVIIGMLAIMALPKYMDLNEESLVAERDGIVSSVNAAILLKHSKNMSLRGEDTYPRELDNEPIGRCIKCFGNVMNNPLDDKNWKKVEPNVYVFTIGDDAFRYTYSSKNGSFRDLYK